MLINRNLALLISMLAPLLPVVSTTPVLAQTRPVRAYDLHQILAAAHASKLTGKEASALEEKLRSDPNDFESRIMLLGCYSLRQFKSLAARKARQRHILWVIQYRPDSRIAASPYAQLDPILDGEKYFEAKRLWLQQVERHAKDTIVLGNAARFLHEDTDLAEKLYRKAKSLDPKNPEWAGRRGFLYELEYWYAEGEQRKIFARKSLQEKEEALRLTKGENDKFGMMADLGETAFEAGDLKKAQSYATGALTTAQKHKNHWNYGEAIHHGNIVLGRIALREGKVKEAKEYLLKAGEVPGPPEPSFFDPDLMLAKELLEKGEKETVLAYLELCGKFWRRDDGWLKKWKALIKAGIKPDFKAR